jgi:hypothetical protein
MKYENNGDVRASSANAAYAGVQFEGELDDAIAQAKTQPDHGVPALNGRAELLSFLRVKPEPKPHPLTVPYQRAACEVETASLIPAPEPAVSADLFPRSHPEALSPYSLAYAIQRGWVK